MIQNSMCVEICTERWKKNSNHVVLWQITHLYNNDNQSIFMNAQAFNEMHFEQLPLHSELTIAFKHIHNCNEHLQLLITKHICINCLASNHIAHLNERSLETDMKACMQRSSQINGMVSSRFSWYIYDISYMWFFEKLIMIVLKAYVFVVASGGRLPVQ